MGPHFYLIIDAATGSPLSIVNINYSYFPEILYFR